MMLFKSASDEKKDAANAALTRIKAFGIKLRRLNNGIQRISEVSGNIPSGMATMDDLAEAANNTNNRIAEANEVLDMLRDDLEELFAVLDLDVQDHSTI